MALIYTDVFNPPLADDALTAFRRLMELFTRRLAVTTNEIRPTNKRLVYRILTHYLSHGVKPEDLTIITFNQDIQVEKSLELMSTIDRWASLSDRIFAFPGLYALPGLSGHMTSPRGDTDLFAPGGDEENCIRLLKLHGSLNWYSSHSVPAPSRNAMFKPSRRINVTRRRTIDPGMALQSTQRQMYTLPVIVPPVSSKSAVLHDDVAGLWQLSEAALRSADELLVFGYSCPPLDFESSNQLRRSQVSRRKPAIVSIIDPAPEVSQRYITLLEAHRLHYYSSGHDFLASPA